MLGVWRNNREKQQDATDQRSEDGTSEVREREEEEEEKKWPNANVNKLPL